MISSTTDSEFSLLTMLKPSHKSKRKLVKKIKSRSDLSGRNPKSNKNKKWKLERNAYPFASSFQGGLGVANGGYHSVSRGETTCVPVLEQRRQGGQITAQLSGNPSGSLYEVWVANFQGLPNCINAQLCRPQATTRIVTQRQSKRGLEAMIRQTYSLLCTKLATVHKFRSFLANPLGRTVYSFSSHSVVCDV